MLLSLLIAGFVLMMIFRSRAVREGTAGYAGRVTAPVRSRLATLPAQYRELLNKYFRYYRGLSDEHKAIFEQRVLRFFYSKKFISRGMHRVPPEMAILVAAVAVQLTFGFPHVYLRHFDKILIYPDNYYSNITKRFHKGEVNPAFGIIVLSWENFKEGFLNFNNEMNLGLHEMAHALRLENLIRNDEYSFFDSESLARLDHWGHLICHEPGRLEATFFRPYACSDSHEFFSVSVENFFERPERFASELPELYSILAKLLNQDPRLISPQHA